MHGFRIRSEFRALRRHLAALSSSTDGVAAIEFAFVLPAMVAMYFGLVAITVGANTQRKLTSISRTVADLTGRASKMSDDAVKDVTGAAAAILAPYDPNGLTITVASVVVLDPTGTGTSLEARVCWSAARKFAADGTSLAVTPAASLAPNTVITPIPDGYRTANSTFIMSKVTQLYRPMVGDAMTGSINLGQTTPWPIRNVQEVTYPGVSTFKDVQMSRSATGGCLN